MKPKLLRNSKVKSPKHRIALSLWPVHGESEPRMKLERTPFYHIALLSYVYGMLLVRRALVFRMLPGLTTWTKSRLD